MNLETALSLGKREVVSLVGGGGKTTLLFALGDELSRTGRGVILTTTTKIWEPPPSSSFGRIYSADLSVLKNRITEDLDRIPCILVARERDGTGKLRGIEPQWVDEIALLPGVSRVIVEADGAAGRPLKAPREGEPVIPGNTTLVVPIAGIDAMNAPLDEAHVFRSVLAASLLGVEIGSTVTPQMIAALLAQAVRKGPLSSRVIPFINKLDLPGGLKGARSLARVLLSHDSLGAEQVILGQAASPPRVTEIFSRNPISP